MKKQLVIFAVVTVAVTLLSPAAMAAWDEWPMFHHDPALTGVSLSPAPATADLLWTYDAGYALQSSPAIADGKLYIGGLNGTLYCIDAHAGELLWSFATGKAIYSSSAVAGGIVYVLATGSALSPGAVFYALDADTGEIVWNAGNMGAGWSWSSPAVHEGRVVIASSSGWVHSFDADTGDLIWKTYIGASPNSPITIANGKVYSGTHNFDNNAPTLAALNELTGAVIWTYSYADTHDSAVGFINSNGAAVADGDGDGDLEVYFGVVRWTDGAGDTAIALDEATGTELWTQDIKGWSTSTPAVHDGKVFIGSDDKHLYALDAGTGDIVWSYAAGDAIWAAPAAADGKIYFGSLDHKFYALDESSGALLWSYDTSHSRMMGSPAIAYGKVYFGNENGKVYAFGPRTVSIDVKPGSYPNSINRGSKGKVPVAVLSSSAFDATSVNPETILFSDAHALSIGLSPQDVNGDGLADLVLHFSTPDLNLAADAVEACLTGTTYGGQSIYGCDSVRIVK